MFQIAAEKPDKETNIETDTKQTRQDQVAQEGPESAPKDINYEDIDRITDRQEKGRYVGNKGTGEQKWQRR